MSLENYRKQQYALTSGEIDCAEHLMYDVMYGNVHLNERPLRIAVHKLRARRLANRFATINRVGDRYNEVQPCSIPVLFSENDNGFIVRAAEIKVREVLAQPQLATPAQNEFVAHIYEEMSVINGLAFALSGDV